MKILSNHNQFLKLITLFDVFSQTELNKKDLTLSIFCGPGNISHFPINTFYEITGNNLKPNISFDIQLKISNNWVLKYLFSFKDQCVEISLQETDNSQWVKTYFTINDKDLLNILIINFLNKIKLDSPQLIVNCEQFIENSLLKNNVLFAPINLGVFSHSISSRFLNKENISATELSLFSKELTNSLKVNSIISYL